MLISDGGRLASVLSDRKSPTARRDKSETVWFYFYFLFIFEQVLALEPFLN